MRQSLDFHVGFAILLRLSLLGTVQRSSAFCMIPWISHVLGGGLEKNDTTWEQLGHHKTGDPSQSQFAPNAKASCKNLSMYVTGGHEKSYRLQVHLSHFKLKHLRLSPTPSVTLARHHLSSGVRVHLRPSVSADFRSSHMIVFKPLSRSSKRGVGMSDAPSSSHQS